MNRLIHYLFLAIVLSFSAKVQAQIPDKLSILFYNVENYFDTINNPHNLDQFTPDDIYEWTHERFIRKRDAIAQAIESSDTSSIPDMIGLCEIENRFVLQHLTDSTGLRRQNYSILHHDSPDSRGIDVALLYRKERFHIIDSAFFLMGNHPGNRQKREILYAKGIVDNMDTLHIFVCHFPSKRAGVKKTTPLRMSAAQSLRHAIDSILSTNSIANIVAMGDFNDTYNSKTLTEGLGVNKELLDIQQDKLYNLSASLAKKGEGSTKYRKQWQLVDMFFVSGNLLKPASSLFCRPEDVSIVNPGFLLEYTPATNSYRPKPTFRWINYIGGYSDHLPVLMQLHTGRK